MRSVIRMLAFLLVTMMLSMAVQGSEVNAMEEKLQEMEKRLKDHMDGIQSTMDVRMTQKLNVLIGKMNTQLNKMNWVEDASERIEDVQTEQTQVANNIQHSVNELTTLINTTINTNKEVGECNVVDPRDLYESGFAGVGEALPAYTSGPLQPCEDSTFNGQYPLNVCAAVIRFRICRINHIIAYHCCQSCTNSGQLPEEGPWRFMTFPRTVSYIDALHLMRKL